MTKEDDGIAASPQRSPAARKIAGAIALAVLDGCADDYMAGGADAAGALIAATSIVEDLLCTQTTSATAATTAPTTTHMAASSAVPFQPLPARAADSSGSPEPLRAHRASRAKRVNPPAALPRTDD